MNTHPVLARFLGILPDCDEPVSYGTRLRLTSLALVFWLIGSLVAGTSFYQPIYVGQALPLWIALCYLSPSFIIPIFLYYCLKTAEQWRAFMLCLYLSLPIYLGAFLLIPPTFSLGDLPTLPAYSHLVFANTSSNPTSVIEVTLPIAPLLWILLIHIHVSSNFPKSWVKLITLAYWGALTLIPINTGLISYLDILFPPCLLGLIIYFLCRNSEKTS